MTSLINLVLNDKRTITLDTSKNIKPEKPKGYLVNTPFYKVPVEYFGDLAKDTYGIVKGWRGQANDHALGKQNDVGLKLGAAAIAAYLLTFRQAKLPKIMEIVGATTFLSSMALWPKLAIALPLKARTGVDIQQKYVDSYGRKKYFYMDSQYLPWDLYSKEQINKMGQKMKVPLDVPNRDEVIREKARKLSVQGNTLWMATAGFATPIMTALVCNALEPVIEKAKQNYDLKKTQKVMDSLNLNNSNTASSKAAKEFDALIESHIGQRFETNKELIEKLNLGKYRTALFPEKLNTDLDRILSNVNNDINKEYVSRIYDTMIEPLSKAGIEKKELEEAFKSMNLYGKQKDVVSKFKAIKPSSTAEDLRSVTKEILDKLVTEKVTGKKGKAIKALITNEQIDNVINLHNRKIIDEDIATQLKKVFKEMSNYFRREEALKNWENARFGNNADSMAAYSWKRVSNEIFSAMGINGKELDILKNEGPASKKLFEQKVEKLVQNPEKYKKVISKIAKKIAEFDTVNNEASRTQYRNYVDTLCDLSQNGLSKLGFTSTANYIGGRNKIFDETGLLLNEREALSGSIRNYKKVVRDFNVLGERASLYRLIQTLDLYKRINDGTFEAEYKEICSALSDQMKYRKPNYKDLVKLSKQVMMSAGPGAHEVKHNLKGRYMTYKTLTRLLFGAMPDKFVINNVIMNMTSDKNERAIISAAAEKSGLKGAYEAALELGFDKVKLNKYRTGLAEETLQSLYEASIQKVERNGKAVDLVENIKTYMQTFIDKVSNYRAKLNPRMLLEEHDVSGAMKGLPDRMSPTLKAKLVGSTTEELIRKGAQEAANRLKWLKVFGISGGVLLVGTVLATFFFGHLPLKEMYMKDENKR